MALCIRGIQARSCLSWSIFRRRYEDRRRFDAFPNQPSANAVCLRGTVIDASLKFIGSRGRTYEAIVMDGSGGVFGSGKITCRWFNMPFIQKVIASGHEVIVYGRVKDVNGRLIIDHPEFEMIRDDDASIHLERIVPIYRNISGIAQRRLREIIHVFLTRINPETLEWVSDPDPGSPRAKAFLDVHFPESIESVKPACRGFAFEELFALQLNVAWRRARYGEHSGRVLGRNVSYLRQFHASLPFELTNAQKRSIREIVADMRTGRPMNRLLQGDVGSGKTFVAMAAMLLAIGSGCQAALMAPTQILAEQHYLTFRRWLDPLGIRVALRTGNRDEGSHHEDVPQIIIGTHALLYDSVPFEDLGLVVIDEQHKFGVAQRASLIRQGVVPDVLVMTATPIPRTLTMTIYGDLDVSLLDEKPPGRGKIITAMRIGAKQSDVTKFVKDQLVSGTAGLSGLSLGRGKRKSEGRVRDRGVFEMEEETGFPSGRLDSRETSSRGEGGGDGFVPAGRNRRACFDDRDRGRRGCAECQHHDPASCRAFWLGPAPSASRPHRPRRSQGLLCLVNRREESGIDGKTRGSSKHLRWIRDCGGRPSPPWSRQCVGHRAERFVRPSLS